MNFNIGNACISNTNISNPTPKTVWIDIKDNQKALHNCKRIYKFINSITTNTNNRNLGSSSAKVLQNCNLDFQISFELFERYVLRDAKAQELAKNLYNKALQNKDVKQTLTLLKLAADLGHAEAQYKFATFRLDSVGEAKNLNEGFKYMKLSADQGHADAQYLLAACYEGGIGVEKDINKAFQYAKSSADQGLANARIKLAIYFGNGLGTKQNLKESRIQLELAADQGHAAAQYHVAHFLMDDSGEGEVDFERALKLIKLSAKQGFKEAIDYLSIYNPKETPKVHPQKNDNTLSDDQELAKDLYNTALLNLAESNGKIDKHSFTLIEMAADKGMAQAQLKLSSFYRNGMGTEKDEKKAFHYVQLSAKQGLVEAQSTLAAYHWQGIGTKVDLKEAQKQLQIAADKGFADAQFGLGYFLFNGLADEKNVQEAERLIILSANQGCDEAIDFLKANDLFKKALSYLEGSEFDFEEGSRLMQEAAKAGHAEAKLYLGL